jgi:hypothetical protein
MSQSANRVDDTDEEVTLTDEEVERLARANGWRPKDQWKRDPDSWSDARTFVARGFENPAIVRERNRVLTERLNNLEVNNKREMDKLGAQVTESREVIQTMTTMLRTSEQRALERARREVKDRQEKAVETGDTAAFREAEREREELDKIKLPEAPAVRTQTPTPTPTPTAPGNTQLDPAVQAFFDRNKWYDPTNTSPDRDRDMMEFADRQWIGLDATHKELPLAQRIEIVERELRQRFPDKFGMAGRRVTADPDPDADLDGDDGNPRRRAPGNVTPASQEPAPRTQRGRFTFDTMPKESKDAFLKYKRQIDSQREQKGNHIPPLTKEEWAADYWSQYRDDGNP